MMEKNVCDFTFNGVVGLVCVDLWQGTDNFRGQKIIGEFGVFNFFFFVCVNSFKTKNKKTKNSNACV